MIWHDFLRLDGSTYNKPKKSIKAVYTVFESDKVYTVPDIGPKLVEIRKKQNQRLVALIARTSLLELV
ncbi:hypothetical protein DTX80_17525 [Bacilli bacterium]|nr:hypothetical protein WH51_14200 [Bacilli bacterium VT-13-104]PZD83272.1 hypothetical protein DEJ64_15500 [Bacilli bacterium]PZD84456.1 hypothetical protein DEJ60_14580 [Bacilli bacterium]PZD86676.1 hypothetical protein DEJ66_15150 [Bacilli bacterium]RCO04336.1 hypothetical protein DTX80_17525 [Bacilli bacterium]